MINISIFRAARAHFLPASIIPFFIGAAYAYNKGFSVSLINFTLGFVGVVSAHLAANLFNDYFDDRSGADALEGNDNPFFGGSKAIQKGVYSAGEILGFSLFFLFLSLLCGIIISFITRNPVIVVIMVIAGILAVQYTAPPLRLAYNKLGEVDIFLLFGVFLVAGSFYLLTGLWELDLFLLSLPVSFLIAGVIICNEIPDFESDARVKKNTLVVYFGRERGYILYGGVVLLSLVSLWVNIWLKILPPWSGLMSLFYLIGLVVYIILKSGLKNKKIFTRVSALTVMLHSVVGIGILIVVLKG